MTTNPLPAPISAGGMALFFAPHEDPALSIVALVISATGEVREQTIELDQMVKKFETIRSRMWRSDPDYCTPIVLVER